MNCVGIGPTGRVVRFPALGPISGDLAAGGEWLGVAALAASVRARDGRGPRTSLEKAIPAHFALPRAEAVVQAVYRGRIEEDRLTELPPVVFRAAAAGDEVSRSLLDTLADEVLAMAVATIRRLRVAREDVDVVLGGGIFRARDAAFMGRIVGGIEAAAPRAHVVRLEAPPLLGAALLGLDDIGSRPRAAQRLRSSIERVMTDAQRRERRGRSARTFQGV